MTYCGASDAVGRLLVAERVGRPPAVDLRPPAGQVAAVAGVVLGLHRGDQVGDDLAGSRRRSARRPCGSWRSRPGRCRRGSTFACGANGRACRSPGRRSGRPGDRAGRPSAARVTAATVPCMPGMPRCWGWLSGNAPRAISVVTTGMPVSSASTPQLGRGARLEHAAADVEHRPPGLGDQPGRLADLLAVRLGHRAVAGQVQRRRPAERGLGLQRVLGRCRPAPGRAGRCAAMWNASAIVRGISVGVCDQEVVLGDRHA